MPGAMRYVVRILILLDKQAMARSPRAAAAAMISANDRGTDVGLRVAAVLQAARRSGLLGEKTGRIGGRVSPELVEQAKRRTGIASDSELIEFALAAIALEDEFSAAFESVDGTVDPTLKLGY